MPNPSLSLSGRGLRRGGRDGKTHKGRNKKTWRTGSVDGDKAVQQRVLKMLSNPVYRKTLQEKLNDLTLHPSVHVALLYFAWGKPRDSVEIQQVVPVRIEHVYTQHK